MKLDDLSNYGKDLNRTKLIYGLITLMSVATVPIVYYINLQKVTELTSHPIVVDAENRQYRASRRPLTASERHEQYIKQAEEFWFLSWNLDKGNYDEHINRALEISGESAEKLYGVYFIEKGFERLIKENNYRSENVVLDCQVDADTIPHIGYIKSRWTIIRPTGQEVRNLHATFIVRDVGISHKNPMGVEIDQLDIYDNSRVIEKD